MHSSFNVGRVLVSNNPPCRFEACQARRPKRHPQLHHLR